MTEVYRLPPDPGRKTNPGRGANPMKWDEKKRKKTDLGGGGQQGLSAGCSGKQVPAFEQDPHSIPDHPSGAFVQGPCRPVRGGKTVFHFAPVVIPDPKRGDEAIILD